MTANTDQLFTPIDIKGIAVKNRFAVAQPPCCPVAVE